MILECTECRTRYVVPDAAIGADGRTVRCAACKHSWFQPGPAVLDLVARAEIAPAAAAPAPDPAPDPAPGPGPDPAPTVIGPPPDAGTPGTLPDYDAFAHRPPFRPRRNTARRWTIAALAAGIAMLGVAGAVLYSGAPGMATQLFRPAEGTPLQIINKPIDRHIYNGTDIFAVSGIVRNPTDLRQPVPDIRADLRDAQQRIVFSWIIRPDAAVLPPKGQVQFDSARVDVPVNARVLQLSFAGEPSD